MQVHFLLEHPEGFLECSTPELMATLNRCLYSSLELEICPSQLHCSAITACVFAMSVIMGADWSVGHVHGARSIHIWSSSIFTCSQQHAAGQWMKPVICVSQGGSALVPGLLRGL